MTIDERIKLLTSICHTAFMSPDDQEDLIDLIGELKKERDNCDKHKVITLSGSLRFWDNFLRTATELSMKGNIVLMPFKDPREGSLPEEAKNMYDHVHQQRIDMSDELYVINENGYIGKSTLQEIQYAMKVDKEVGFQSTLSPSEISVIFDNMDPDVSKEYFNVWEESLLKNLIILLMNAKLELALGEYNFVESSMKINPVQNNLRNLCEYKHASEYSTTDYDHVYTDAFTKFSRSYNKRKFIDQERQLYDISKFTLPGDAPWSRDQLLYNTSSELIGMLSSNDENKDD